MVTKKPTTFNLNVIDSISFPLFLLCKPEFDEKGFAQLQNKKQTKKKPKADYSSLPGPHGSLHLILLVSTPNKFISFQLEPEKAFMIFCAKTCSPEIIAQKGSTGFRLLRRDLWDLDHDI